MGSTQEDPATHFEDNLPKALDKRLQNFNFQNFNFNFKTRRQFLQQKVLYRNSVKKALPEKVMNWTGLFNRSRNHHFFRSFYRFVI